MLLFDDSKKLEKAIGEEAASVIAHVFEQADAKQKQELATKADLAEAEARLMAAISNSRAETMKWTAGLLMAQAAVIAALVKLL